MDHPPSGFKIKTIQTLNQVKQVWSFAALILDLPSGKHTLQYYEEQYSRIPELLVFAERDRRICGCVLASVEEDHVLVGPVAVALDARRMGIGSALMGEVESRAKEMGQSTLILGAQEEAESFYLSCGFKPNLFIQHPEPSLGRLKSLNNGYDVIWESQQEGWSRLMLRTPEIDKQLQHQYEREFQNCFTQYIFIKNL